MSFSDIYKEKLEESNLPPSSDEWIKLTDRYEWYDDFDDTVVSYVDNYKNIIIDRSQTNISREELSQFIQFEMPRKYDNFDLINTTIQFHYINPVGDEDYVTAVNVRYNDNKIRFCLLVPYAMTMISGKIKFEIQATGKNSKGENYKWISRACENLNVIASLSGNGIVEITDPDWYGDFVRIMDEKVMTANTYANEAKQSATESESSAQKSEQSANEASNSELNAKEYADAAKLSETNAKNSETNAKQSEDNAKQSEINAKSSKEKASQSELNALQHEEQAKQYSESANQSAINANQSEQNAKQSEINVDESETKASESELKAKQSEENAAQSETNARQSAENASLSETNASQYMEHAKQYSESANTSAENAEQSSVNANQSAVNAKQSEDNANEYKNASIESENNAKMFSNLSEAWAHGHADYPEHDQDNSMYYAQQAQSSKNTALENANLAVTKAEETEADRAEVAQNKSDVEQLKAYIEQLKHEVLQAEQRVIQLMSSDTKSYFFATIAQRDAEIGVRNCDRCSVYETRADYIYDNQNIDGDEQNPEWIKTSDWDALKSVAWDIIIDKPNFATVATSGQYSDLIGIPNKYDSPIVLDGTSDTIAWDYSESDTALVTLTADKALTISNSTNGARASLDVYGAKLILDDATYLKSATYAYLEAVEGEHYHYEFQRLADKWLVGMMVVAGGVVE